MFCQLFSGSNSQDTTNTITNTNNANANVDNANDDEPKKQGAYGKIQTHKESSLKQIIHIDEIIFVLILLIGKPFKSNIHSDHVHEQFVGKENELQFCIEMLDKVSRSFAAVIQQLPSNLVVDIMIFYLVLRALDTIEDDTTAFESNRHIKIHLLQNFYHLALEDPNWTMDGVGEGAERRLLQEFTKCQAIYSLLNPTSKLIISDITKRMGEGMANTVEKDFGQGTKDVKEYNKYCHYVAGLVGEGLSRLFAQCGLEDTSFADEIYLSDQMGLFLQKTNIIRDYLEDYVDGRAFWPQSIWKKYSKSGDLGYFANQSESDVQEQSLACLNELVTDALELVPECLTYLAQLKCLEIFRFCAIPQVMAIATLSKCYANNNVFTGVVKIRKSLSCKLILKCNNLDQVHATFYEFAKSIATRAHTLRKKGIYDPTYYRTIQACDIICNITSAAHNRQKQAMIFTLALLIFHFVPHLRIFIAVWAIINLMFGPLKYLGDDSPIKTAHEIKKLSWTTKATENEKGLDMKIQ